MKVTGEAHPKGVKLVIKASLKEVVQLVKVGFAIRKYTVVSYERKGLTHTAVIQTTLSADELVKEIGKVLSKSKLK